MKFELPKIGQSWLMTSSGQLFMYFRSNDNTIVEISFKPYTVRTWSFEAGLWTFYNRLST